MADENLRIVTIQDDFYRDGFKKILIVLLMVLFAIVLLASISIYLHYTKPSPTTFFVDREFRVQGAVSVDQPYLSEPDMLQWVGASIPRAFSYDFLHYNDQLKKAQTFFTENGWQVFLNHLNNYVSYNYVTTNKLFVNGTPAGAPYILDQRVLSGRYAWLVQMPVLLKMTGYGVNSAKTLTLQILVVRISTLNNLNGIAIDNVLVTNASNTTMLTTPEQQ